MRWSSRLAWSLFGLSVLAAACFVSLVALNRHGRLEYREFLWLTALYVLLIVTFPFLGALIASRHAANPIGWMFCAAGNAVGLGFCAQLYADYVLSGPASLPGGLVAGWASSWLVPAGLFVTPTVLLYIFPDGRAPSPRWSLWLRAMLAAAAAGFVAMMFAPGPLETFPELENPFVAPGPLATAADVVGGLGPVLVVPGFLLGVVAMIIRFRRSTGERRQQMKAIAYPAGLMGASFALTFAFSMLGNQALADIAFVSGVVSLIGIFVGAALGILRYGLYEIDVVINRTLVYGALTAILTGAYFGFVVLFQAAVPGAGDSELAVAGSTLAIAALFRPARSRVQAFIDRRFYRHKYDAAATLDRFSARLRDQVDLESLRSEIVSVIGTTMQPAHASVWLRAREEAR